MGLKQEAREWKLRTGLEAKIAGLDSASDVLASSSACSRNVVHRAYLDGKSRAFTMAADSLRKLLTETEED